MGKHLIHYKERSIKVFDPFYVTTHQGSIRVLPHRSGSSTTIIVRPSESLSRILARFGVFASAIEDLVI